MKTTGTALFFALLVSFIVLYGCCGATGASNTPSTPKDAAGKIEKLNPEVRLSFDMQNGMYATITNRNSYRWTGLVVIADDYYRCDLAVGQNDTLEPSESVMVVPPACIDGADNSIESFSKLRIKTDEGEGTYGKR